MTPPDADTREEKSNMAIIGWPTIRKLAAEGAVLFPEHGVALAAADDLFHADIGAVLPLSLAQRILAALEAASTEHPADIVRLQRLAAELRAVIGK